MYILTTENMYGMRKLINTENLIQCYCLDNEVFADFPDGAENLGVYEDGEQAERELTRLYRSISKGSHGHRMREGVFCEKPGFLQRFAEWWMLGDNRQQLDVAEMIVPPPPPPAEKNSSAETIATAIAALGRAAGHVWVSASPNADME